MADHVVVEKDTNSGSSALVAVVAIVVLAVIAWFAYQYFAGGSAPTTNVNVSTPSVTGQ